MIKRGESASTLRSEFADDQQLHDDSVACFAVGEEIFLSHSGNVVRNLTGSVQHQPSKIGIAIRCFHTVRGLASST